MRIKPIGYVLLILLMSLLAGCTKTIGGTITGLTSAGLVLQNNYQEYLVVPAGSDHFTFPTGIESGSGYSVTIMTQPDNQICSVSSNGSGMVGDANVSSIVISCVAVSVSAKDVSFYVHAHPDDIELFMGRHAANDVKSGTKKVVFVLTTAGNGDPAMPDPSYYKARLEGHDAALKSWLHLRGTAPGDTFYSYVTIGGKTVQKGEVCGRGSNVITYNLLLQDGGLKTFRDKSLTDPSYRIASIDGTADYTWSELTVFLQALIETEQNSAGITWVNIPEFNPKSYDHPDHIETGRLATQALEDYERSNPSRCISSIRYVDYGASGWPINYSEADQVVQHNAWQALITPIVNAGYPSPDDIVHNFFLYKLYFSSTSSEPGGETYYGSCLSGTSS